MTTVQKTLRFEVKKESGSGKSDLSLICASPQRCASPGKSDLSLIWERTGSPSPFSSPSPKRSPSCDRGNDILSLLVASRRCETPRKKLRAPAALSPAKPQRAAPPPPPELFFKSVSVLTDRPFDVPKHFLRRVTYTFLGGEHQAAAWASFKAQLSSAACAVVSTPTMLFLLSDGRAQAKAITGTAQRRLEALSESLPSLPQSAAVGLVDEVCGRERVHLFSTSEFHYSTVIPSTFEQTKFGSAKGQKYRTLISGYLFPFEVELLQADAALYGSFALQRSAL